MASSEKENFVIDPRTFQDELEHELGLTLHQIESLAEEAFASYLSEIGREVNAYHSLEELHARFEPEPHNPADRNLDRRDEIFLPGLYATELVRKIEAVLAAVTKNMVRFITGRNR
jgi:hypothetical protein